MGCALAAFGFAFTVGGLGFRISFGSVVWFAGVASTILFVLFSAAYAVILFSDSQLRLSQDGFAYRTKFAETFYPWDQVRNFRVKRLVVSQHVTFDRIGAASGPSQGMIPTFFDMTPTELVKLLEEFKTRGEASGQQS